jgi:hypothetical protein
MTKTSQLLVVYVIKRLCGRRGKFSFYIQGLILPMKIP